MNPSNKKYPSAWYQGRQRKYHQLEQARLTTVDAIEDALNHLEERYTWDDAYIMNMYFQNNYYDLAQV